jgi:hypothetical protein
VDQHALAGLEVAALDQREVGGAVVEDDRRAGLERDRVGQREHELLGGRHLLGEATQQVQRRDAVARRELRCLGRGDDLTGHLGPGDEGQVGLHLVLPAALQDLGEGDARRVDADQDLVADGGGLGDLDQLDLLGTVERGDVYGTHGTTLAREGKQALSSGDRARVAR